MRKSPLSLLLTSSVSMQFFLPYFERHGIAWQRKAKNMGLPLEYSNPDEWIPLKNYSLFLKEVEVLANEDMPVVVGKENAEQFVRGKRGYIQPHHDLKQALSAMMANSHSLSRQNSYWLEKIKQNWCLCNKGEIQPSFSGYVLIEWFRLSLLMTLCRNWLGEDWAPSHVHVMTSEALGKKYEPYLFTNTKVVYNQPFLKIELPGHETFEPFASRPLKSRSIQEIILLANSYCHLPSFNLEWLASLFGVTSKTLYRYFQDHDTSFLSIKQQAVLDKTLHFLQDSEEPIGEIAYRMGYSDVSNFNRAIKSLSGVTPAQLRRRIQTSP